jgi:hypothetical protein
MAWIDPDWPEVTREDMKRWGRQPVPDTPAARTVNRVGIVVGLATIGLVLIAAAVVLIILL